jgi:UDP-N-acetylmuramyl tripeptide synthase
MPWREVRILRGPNVFDDAPCYFGVVRLDPNLDVAPLHQRMAEHLPALADLVLADAPALLAALITALHATVGAPVRFARVVTRTDGHALVFGHDLEPLARRILTVALAWLEAAQHGPLPGDVPATLEALRALVTQHRPDASLEALRTEAQARDLPLMHIAPGLVQIGWGVRQLRLDAARWDPLPAEALAAAGRIPLIAVTGTNGKTTTVLLLDHVLRAQGLVTGATTTEGVRLAGQLTEQGDCTGYWSARTVLAHPEVQAAVLEVARGGIVKRGLGFDRADVGVVLNVSADHLGLDGIATVEDLAEIKQIVARVAHRAVVLNAEDDRVAAMAHARRPGAEVLWFSLDPQHPRIVTHLGEGGRAVVLDGSQLLACQGPQRTVVADVADLPFTWAGAARHNVANGLAAVAALWALGQPLDRVGPALAGFQSHAGQNPGRLNLVHMPPVPGGGYDVVVDYCHNPASYRAMLETVQALGYTRLLGVVTVPGDRPQAQIEEIGGLCAPFDLLVVRELDDRRGREAGEVARFLVAGARDAGMPLDRIEVFLEDAPATERALDLARPGDLVVICCAETFLALA